MLVKIFQRMALCMLVVAVVFCSLLSTVAVGATEAEAEAETETSVTQQKPIIDIIKSQSGYIPEELYNTDLYEGELVGCDLRDYVILPVVPYGVTYSLVDIIGRGTDTFIAYKGQEHLAVLWSENGQKVQGVETSTIINPAAVQDIIASKIYESVLHSANNTYKNVILFSSYLYSVPEGETVFYIGDKETIAVTYEHIYYSNSSEEDLLRGEYRINDFVYYRDMMRRYIKAKSVDDKGHTQHVSIRFDDFVKQMQSGEITEEKIIELESAYRKNHRLYQFLTEYHDTVAGITCAIIAVVVVIVGAVVTVIIVKRKKKRARLQAEASLAESGTESAENTEAEKIE